MACSCGKKGCKGCRKGYAYGTKMVSPMGYYLGTPSAMANPEEEEQISSFTKPRMAEIQPVQTGPSPASQFAAPVVQAGVEMGVDKMFGEKAAEEVAKEGVNAVSAAQLAGADAATQAGVDALTSSLAGEGVKIAGQEATKAAANAASSGLSGAMGNALVPGLGGLAIGLLDDGQIDSGEAAGAAGAAAGAALGSVVPGIGTAIGGILGGLAGSLLGGGSKAPPKAPAPLAKSQPTQEQVAALNPETDYEKMMKEIPAGFSDGTTSVKEKTTDPIKNLGVNQKATASPQQQGGIDLKALAEKGLLGIFPAIAAKGFSNGTPQVSPEEAQMKFIMEKFVNPAKAYVEERPMLQAPLFLAGAAERYSRGKLPLGEVGGGRIEGGKDRIAYRHDTFGDFEYNPKDERVTYKKTIRF